MNMKSELEYWKEYTGKQKIPNQVVYPLIEMFREFKPYGKDCFTELCNIFSGAYNKEIQQKNGLNYDLMYSIWNKINCIGTLTGPCLTGLVKLRKLNLFQKYILRKSCLYTVYSESIINNFICLFPEYKEEILKRENNKFSSDFSFNLRKLSESNEPNNLKPEYKKYLVIEPLDYQNIEITDSTKEGIHFRNIEHPISDLNEDSWFIDNFKPTEKYFKDQAIIFYHKMVKKSEDVLKMKSTVLMHLKDHTESYDKKVYEVLLNNINILYEFLNGSTEHIKGEKTQLVYSMTELLEKYINKDNSNFKHFF